MIELVALRLSGQQRHERLELSGGALARLIRISPFPLVVLGRSGLARACACEMHVVLGLLGGEVSDWLDGVGEVAFRQRECETVEVLHLDLRGVKRLVRSCK